MRAVRTMRVYCECVPCVRCVRCVRSVRAVPCVRRTRWACVRACFVSVSVRATRRGHLHHVRVCLREFVRVRSCAGDMELDSC